MPRDNFPGKWKLVRSENFEPFLEKMGAPWIARKMAAKSSPTMELIQNGDNFVVKTTTGFWTREATFTIDVEDIQDHDNTKMKSVVKWDGDKMVQTEEPVEEGKGKSLTTTREINEEGEMVMVITVEDLVCTRVYKRLD